MIGNCSQVFSDWRSEVMLPDLTGSMLRHSPLDLGSKQLGLFNMSAEACRDRKDPPPAPPPPPRPVGLGAEYGAAARGRTDFRYRLWISMKILT